MKYLLIFGYSTKNAGDFAITLGTIDYFLSRNHDIDIISKDHSTSEEFKKTLEIIKNKYPQITVYPHKFKLRRNKKILLFLDYFVGFLKSVFRIHGNYYKNIIKNYDGLLFGGGNVLRGESLTDLIRLKGLFYPFIFNKKKIPVYVLPSSTGKMNTSSKRLVYRFLKTTEMCFVREPDSLTIFQKLFPRISHKFLLSADMAFHIKHKFSKEVVENRKKLSNVGITLRIYTIGDIKPFDEGKKQVVFNQIKELIFGNKDKKFHFIVQTTKDMFFTKSVFEYFRDLGFNVFYFESHDPISLIKYYNKLNCLIAMRLHSAILSLSTETPVLGFFDENWGYKNKGLMDYFNLPVFFLNEKIKLKVPSMGIFRKNIFILKNNLNIYF
ncbi:MAG: hypothetical protein GX793_07100 [Bacteroidales bacterium]|jgi:polysaccharide pyruvyl transferase WcaK-like protein|nr:hypothetical protein [Bacteroidales bacterium]